MGYIFSVRMSFFSALTPDGRLLSVTPENKYVTLTNGLHCLREITKSVRGRFYHKREWRMGKGERGKGKGERGKGKGERDEPKKRLPLTSQPEFPGICGKW